MKQNMLKIGIVAVLAFAGTGVFAQYSLPYSGYSNSYQPYQEPQYNNYYQPNYYFQNNSKVRAELEIEQALRAIDQAGEDIDDSRRNTNSAEKSLRKAKDHILNSLIAFYVHNDWNDAKDEALEAKDLAEEASDEADGSKNNNHDRTRAHEAIEDAQDAIDDARDEIEDADDDGDDVDEAEDLLDEAEDALDEAREEYDDRNYDDAEDLANDAEDLAQDAIDSID